MQFLASFKYTYQTLIAHKSRAFLTILGIIIGVAAVIAVMGVGASAQDLLLSQINSLGSDLIGVLPGASDEQGPPASALGIEITTLKYEDAMAIEGMPHIVAVCPYLKGRNTMSFGNKKKDFDYTGVGKDYLIVEDTKLESGRFFRQDEIDGLEKVVVLGSKVEKDLFNGQNPLEQQIKIGQIVFKIIGVMEERGTEGFQNQDEQVLIPIKTAQKIMLGVDHLAFFRAKIDSVGNLDLTIEQTKEVLRYRHRIKDPSKDDFSVRSTAQALDILGTITQALKLFLAAVAGISLVVGGVGIMNIMFVTVNERTKEIGLRKALGARRKDILFQFLVESAALSFLGGIIGIILGILISLAVSFGVNFYGYDWKFIITASSIFVSTLVAISIGLIFGIWPANRASKLNPIDALRK
jgi:ABC-type antimicrobial peptide transport system permease subunit